MFASRAQGRFFYHGAAAHMGEDMSSSQAKFIEALLDRRAATLACACRGSSKSSQRRITTADRSRTGDSVQSVAGRPTSDQIVSWVDGQIVTDWTGDSEAPAGHRRISGRQQIPRARKYGFRSGQNPQLAWHWFRNNPVGFNGVPFVLFKTILDLDPDHENPTLRERSRGSGSARRSCRHGPGWQPGWTLDHIGIGPDPSDYVDGVVRPPMSADSPLRSALRSRTRARSNRCPRPRRRRLTDAPAARRVFQNTSLLIAKLEQRADKEENWERIGPASESGTWIVCSSRAPPATSGG